MASKIEKQWKKEKVTTRTKQTRTNELEQWILDLGAYPHDAKYVHDLIKKIRTHKFKC